jgi:putative membrane protein insertion efficiency factor
MRGIGPARASPRPPARRALRAIVTAPIRFYQRVISPGLPSRGKYQPSGSQYAVVAIRHYGRLRGVVLAAWRLLRCNPWSHGGVDFVQDQKLFRSRTRPEPQA